MQCLTDIIGITRTDCPCITSGATPEQIDQLKASVSGLYIDEHIEGGLSLKGWSQIDACKPFVKIALEARRAAEKVTRDNLIEAMSVRYKANKSSFSGDVGQLSFAASLQVNQRYQSLLLDPIGFSDAVVKVNRIQMIVNAARTINLHLMKLTGYSSSMTGCTVEEIGVWPVTTVSNMYTPVDFGANPLFLPLKEENNPVAYLFWYDSQEDGGGFFPKDNKIDCNCSANTKTIKNFIHVTGGQQSSIDNMGTRVSDEYTRGIILSVDIRCDNDRLFCREYADDDAIAVTLAWAVLFKTEVLMIEKSLESPEVNRYTLQAREYLWGKRNHYQVGYEKKIAYLARTIDVSSSDCFVCRPTGNQPYVGKIFV